MGRRPRVAMSDAWSDHGPLGCQGTAVDATVSSTKPVELTVSPGKNEHETIDQKPASADSKDDSKTRSDVTSEKSKKTDSKKSLSTSKLIASGAAAITASIITTKLAGYMNSLLIVGCSSILIAILSETYSRILKKTKKLSARTIYAIPYEKVLPDSISNSIDSSLKKAMEDTTTIDPIKDVDQSSAKIDVTDTGDDQTEGKNTVESTVLEPVKTAGIVSDQDDDEIPPLSAMIANYGIIRGFCKWLSLQVQSFSTLTKFMMVVLLVTLLSSTVNWAMVKAVDQPNITNVTQQVTKKEVQSIPDSEKKAIQQAAVADSQQQINTLSKQLNSLSRRIDALEKNNNNDDNAVNSNDNKSPSSSPSTPSSQSAISQQPTIQKNYDSQINSLQSEIDSLKTELESLKATIKSNSVDSSNTGATGGSTTNQTVK